MPFYLQLKKKFLLKIDSKKVKIGIQLKGLVILERVIIIIYYILQIVGKINTILLVIVYVKVKKMIC